MDLNILVPLIRDAGFAGVAVVALWLSSRDSKRNEKEAGRREARMLSVVNTVLEVLRSNTEAFVTLSKAVEAIGRGRADEKT